MLIGVDVFLFLFYFLDACSYCGYASMNTFTITKQIFVKVVTHGCRALYHLTFSRLREKKGLGAWLLATDLGHRLVWEKEPQIEQERV